MPTPRQGENKTDFMARCIPEVMREGRTQEEAVGRCNGIWENKKKRKPKKSNIREALENTDGVVTCSNCKYSFYWLGKKEVKMGYVKCPSCSYYVDQEGNAFESK